MSQVFDHPSYKVLVTGTSGTGKSTLLESLVRRERAQWKFVYDHQGEFAARWKLPAVRTAEELEQKTLLKGWVVYDPVQDFPGRAAEGFDFFCEYIFAAAQHVRGRKLFVVDELQKLTDNRKPPEAFLTLCETGRRYQVDVFAVSQAPNRIHNAVRNQLTDVYTFRQSDDMAVKYLSENGFDAEAVRSLEKFNYIHRNLANGQTVQGRCKL
jgi:energy-coupling factor transporter ATP-binding protein EcfA2